MNYTDCTHEEMIAHILKMSSESITRMRVYYRRKGNTDVVNKIDKARERARIIKFEQRLTKMKEVLDENTPECTTGAN